MTISSISLSAIGMPRMDSMSSLVALKTFRDAMDIEKAHVSQLLQALPTPTSVLQPGQMLGSSVDTYA